MRGHIIQIRSIRIAANIHACRTVGDHGQTGCRIDPGGRAFMPEDLIQWSISGMPMHRKRLVVEPVQIALDIEAASTTVKHGQAGRRIDRVVVAGTRLLWHRSGRQVIRCTTGPVVIRPLATELRQPHRANDENRKNNQDFHAQALVIRSRSTLLQASLTNQDTRRENSTQGPADGNHDTATASHRPCPMPRVRHAMVLRHVHVMDHPDQGKPASPDFSRFRFDPGNQLHFVRMCPRDQGRRITFTVPQSRRPDLCPTVALPHRTAPSQVQVAGAPVPIKAEPHSVWTNERFSAWPTGRNGEQVPLLPRLGLECQRLTCVLVSQNPGLSPSRNERRQTNGPAHLITNSG